MPLHAQTPQDAPDGADSSKVDASTSAELDVGAEALAEDDAESEATVIVEFNYNAFADHCPPTKHARRVAKHCDPSIQDFADQALELAALRAELKRLNRDYAALQHAVRLRDIQVQTLREDLGLARAQLRNSPLHPPEARTPSAPAAQEIAPSAAEPRTASRTQSKVQTESQPEAKVAQIKAPPQPAAPAPAPCVASAAQAVCSTQKLATPHFEGSSTIAETSQGAAPAAAAPTPARRLIPVNHAGEPFPLSRDVITIGRTKKNDICIPSAAVSRDHARLLVSARSVTVFDMGSANGCFVNDEPVKRHKLSEGDVLRIGDRSYRYAGGENAGRHGDAP
jgi:FHA domain